MLGSSQMMLLALAVRVEFGKLSGYSVRVTHLLETRKSGIVNSLYANILACTNSNLILLELWLVLFHPPLRV